MVLLSCFKVNYKLMPGYWIIGHVCFPKSSFRETIFQTFLCLFVIRKVSKRKTLSSQFQSKKNLTWFSGNVFPLGVFVFWKVVSGKSLSKLSCVCLPLEKLVNGKHFPVNEKHFLVNRKYLSVNGKHFPVNFSQRKIWLGFQESVFPLAVFVFRKVVSGKSLSKLSCV